MKTATNRVSATSAHSCPTYLKHNPQIQTIFQKDVEATPAVPTVTDFLAAIEEAPSAPDEQEARNQLLGEAGEQCVINFERARLIRAGKATLANRIEHVSSTVGPSAGFDIRSFEENGSGRFIEAKTTD